MTDDRYAFIPGPVPEAVKVAPPFVISWAQIVELLDLLRGALDEVTKVSRSVRK